MGNGRSDMAGGVKESEMSSVHVGSLASPELRDSTAAEFRTLVSAIESSDIVVADLAAAKRLVLLRDVALDPQVPAASWASRFAPADIDGEVLRWIASHVKGRRTWAVN
jgi:hypothetical protein